MECEKAKVNPSKARRLLENRGKNRTNKKYKIRSEYKYINDHNHCKWSQLSQQKTLIVKYQLNYFL